MKTKIAVIAAVLLVALTGCESVQPAEEKGTPGANSFYQELPDGTQVICVRLYSEAVTCDWGHKTVDIGEKK